LTLRRALAIPIAYGVVFAVYRLGDAPKTPEMFAFMLLGGTALAAILLFGRLRLR
jgi:hypothetical protein